jgi:F-type H+-transporting ATPase subunit b
VGASVVDASEPGCYKFPSYSGLRNYSDKGSADRGGTVDILRETLNLIIASLPTTAIAFLFFLFARAVFFRPIMRVLAERAARTEGAKSDAARLDGQAQEKMNAYHRALDKVRAEIYNVQDAARRAALDEWAALLRENRARAGERVRQAKQRLEGELAAARDAVEKESRSLAEETVRAVLAENSSAGLTLEDA